MFHFTEMHLIHFAFYYVRIILVGHKYCYAVLLQFVTYTNFVVTMPTSPILITDYDCYEYHILHFKS